MRRRTFVLVVSACAAWSCGFAAIGAPQEYAATFVRMLKSHQFEAASQEFYYPQSYTEEDLAHDQAAIAKSLATVLSEIGDPEGEPELITGVRATLFFSIRGGNSSHPTPELDEAEKLDIGYDVQVQHAGSVTLTLTLVQFHGRWHVFKFRVGFPATDPDSANRLRAILDAMRRSSDPQMR